MVSEFTYFYERIKKIDCISHSTVIPRSVFVSAKSPSVTQRRPLPLILTNTPHSTHSNRSVTSADG